MNIIIPDDVLEVLKAGRCVGKELYFDQQLDRATYKKVNRYLKRLGGKWNRRAGAHVFDEPAAPLIGDAVATGSFIDQKVRYQFYETPLDLAERLVKMADVKEGMDVLEPSAGSGVIAIAARNAGARVSCVEIQPRLVEKLVGLRFKAWKHDFITFGLSTYHPERYDAIIMNPPFARGQDMRHVQHAYAFLKPKGVLVAVMSIGWTFRSDSQAQHFREWVNHHDGIWEPLPKDIFKKSGTLVRSGILRIYR